MTLIQPFASCLSGATRDGRLERDDVLFLGVYREARAGTGSSVPVGNAYIIVMPEAILATKLVIPPPRNERVPRTRLKRAMSAGVRRKLTLVSAPAGFGKSSLVSDWIAETNVRAVWISLDEGDAEISSFLAYLIAALHPYIGRAEQLVGMSRSSRTTPESVLNSLIDDLASIDGQIIVVLDDYHLVDSRVVDTALQYLLDHMPEALRLVMTTREDPQLGLSRLRARDELTELRVADLRFDADETWCFLNQVMRLELSPSAVQNLGERTEGWVAGLQLAALSMRNESDRERFVEDFSGSHRFVLDYLVEDVLDRLPGRVRGFLHQTSILDRFCGALCDAVTGRTDSVDIMAYLDRANLFVIPLDTERRWYRYHHLFLDLLRVRVRDLGTDSAPLHERASQWYRENGFPLDAFAHAVASGDNDRAADVLQGDGLPLHYRGAFAPVEQWLSSLPNEVLDRRPELRVASAWVLTTRGAPVDEVDRLLEPAEKAVLVMERGRRRDDARGQIAAIRALLAIPQGELVPIITNGQSALEWLDPRNQPVRTMVAWSLGYAHQLLDEYSEAQTAFRQALSDGQASGNLVVSIGSKISLGQVYEAEHRLRQAMQTYHEALQLSGDPPLPYACEAYLGMARILYQQNDLEVSLRYVDLARRIGVQLENADTPGMASLLEAKIALAQGNAEAAMDAVDSAAAVFLDRHIKHHQTDLADVRCGILLADGKTTAALEIAREHMLTDRIAQVFLRNGDPESALETLGVYVRDYDEHGLSTNLTSRIIAAEALWAKRDQTSARNQFAALLAAAEPEAIVRPFIDAGSGVLALLQDDSLIARYPVYIATLKDAFGGQIKAASLAVPLTRRELEVLRLISDGLSNQEIGDRLFIALDTVKGHARKIYDKLDVNRRTEAVARAAEIGLL